MTWEIVGQVAVAVLAAAAGAARLWQSRPGPRESVLKDLELLKELPEASTARQQLGEHIDQTILKSIQHETELRRDPTGIVLGVLFMVGGLISVYFGFQAGGLARLGLWVLAGVLLLLGGVGFAQDVVPRKRDARGRVVE
jgi:hypothetical protein